MGPIICSCVEEPVSDCIGFTPGEVKAKHDVDWLRIIASETADVLNFIVNQL